MGQKIDHLIINSPYEEPKFLWFYDREKRSFEKKDGRRPAGYIVASPDSKSFDDPEVTGITKRILEHWKDKEARENTFFFC